MPPSKKSPKKKKAAPRKKATKKKAAPRKKATAPKKATAAPVEPLLAKDEGMADEKTGAMADLDKMVEAEDAGTPERDYGMGVGEILDVSDEQDLVDESKKTEESAQKDRLSVESILQGHTLPDEPEEDDEFEEALVAKPKKAPRKKRKIRWSVFIPLVVFVLAILLVAEGAGLFGDSGREKTSKLWTSVTSFFGGGTEQIREAPPSEPQPVVPSLVSLNILLSTEGEEEGLSIPVVTTRTIETDVSAVDNFTATGEVKSDDARAVGTISVINDSATDYSFVATTRFMSQDGVLFRLKEASDIPADSTTDVVVYADEVGPEGDIEPAKFTIPGLGAELEDTVYGRSRTAMSGGSGMVAAVSEDDIDKARKEMMARLMDEARENFKSMIANGELVLDDLITSNELESEFPEVETEGGSFKGEMSVRFITLVVPGNEVVTLLETKMVESLPETLNPDDYELGSLLHTVEAYDTTSNRAEIRVEAPIQ